MGKYDIAIACFLFATLLGCTARNSVTPWPELGSQCASEEISGVACGSFYFPVQGRVMFEGAEDHSGDFTILSGFYADGEWIGEMRRVEASVLESGVFSFQASAAHSTRYVCRDGEWKDASVVLDAHFLFRAPGCQDTIVAMRPNASDSVVRMQCW